MNFKNAIREILNFLHLDLTKNLEYDRLTKLIINKSLNSNSNCVDVGCHKGEILDIILNKAPNGTHFAFEPIPDFYNNLKNTYSSKANIFPYALAEKTGHTTFQYVKNAPAYSGLKQRKYAVADPDIEEITVEINTLDNCVPNNIKIDLIKIDVEGGEFGVIKGAKNLIKKDTPIIVFECGLGASDYYHTDPQDLYHFITKECEITISTLKSYISGKPPLNLSDFIEHYESNKEYYFIAHPK